MTSRKRLLKRLLNRLVLRIPGSQRLWQRFPVGPVSLRAEFDIWKERPPYGFGVWEGASLAKRLGITKISVCEFGVGAGHGLIELEGIAGEIDRATGIKIDVIGFDSGQGMPVPADYRDVSHYWRQTWFKMDETNLRAKLRRAHLILGDVAATAPEWIRSDPPPLAFLAFDLDYYSSTAQALRVFEGPPSTRLPRVLCFFDDLIRPQQAYLNEYVGEALAIREFNERFESMKLCEVRGLPTRAYYAKEMYCLHDFDHPLYPVNTYPL